jgi:glycosyltransferase involved in cell wall biosynthesis
MKNKNYEGGALNILHIVGDSKFGGASQLIIKLSNAAKLKGHKVTVLTTDKEFHKHLLDNSIGIIKLDVAKRDSSIVVDFFDIIKLAKFLRNTNFDIVQTHTSKGGFVGRLGAYLAGKRNIIHTVHGFAFHDFSAKSTKIIYSNVEKFLSYFCSKVVTVSKFHGEVAKNIGINKSKIHVIQNGYDISVEELKDEEITKLIKNNFVVACPGRLSEQKGQTVLLRAIKRLNVENKIGNNVKFLFIGSGPDLEELKLFAKSNSLGDIVHFLGFRTDVLSILNSSDVTIIPSLWEGLSIGLIEAMALKNNIICSDIQPNIEALGYSDLYFKANDPESLALKIETFLSLDESSKNKSTQRSFERYQEFFREKKMLDSYVSLYEKGITSE